MISVFLLRHAPTAWNAEGRLQGRADIPLSVAGAAEAATWRLPDWAAGWPCWSSPLRRAIETGEAMGLRPVPRAALTEMDWGEAEGRTLSSLRAQRGTAFAAEEAKGLDFRPPGGETPREAGARAAAFLAGLGASAVVISHKGILRALFAFATGWDMRAKSPLRIDAACCHHLRVGTDGAIAVLRANISLKAAGP